MGRTSHPWVRRVLLALMAVIPVLALLDVFGQGDTDSQTLAPAAALALSGPTHVRGGLPRPGSG